jgi:hypothetical protein
VWRGDHEEARRLFQEALAVATDLGIGRARSYALLGLSSVAEARGELADARRLLGEAASISERLDDKRFLGLQSYMRGLLACDENDLYAADIGFRDALASAAERGEQVLMIRAIEGLARVAAADGDAVRAAILLGAAAARRRTVASPVVPAEVRAYETDISGLRAALGPSSFDAAWRRGLELPVEDAVRFAGEQARPGDEADRAPGQDRRNRPGLAAPSRYRRPVDGHTG